MWSQATTKRAASAKNAMITATKIRSATIPPVG
jgi:hypothetical protein